MTGANDKNKESVQPKRSSARLREVQFSTPTKDPLNEAVSPCNGSNTHGMATRASMAKESVPSLPSPTVLRKRRAQTTPPTSTNKVKKTISESEVIDIDKEISDELLKDIKSSPKFLKKPRRSKRDIRRPKFDDEIVTAPVQSTTAKERRKKTSSASEGGLKTKSSKTDVSTEPSVSHKTTDLKVRATSLPKSSGDTVQVKNSDGELSVPSSTTPKDDNPDIDFKPELPSSEEQVPTSSVAFTLLQKSPSHSKKGRSSKTKSKTCTVKPVMLSYTNPIYNKIVNNLQASWTVEDDILLMASVQHLCDLPAVLAHTQFSQPYSLHDLDERWYLMLYDKQVSKFVRDRINEQTVEFIAEVNKKVPFSVDEDKLIKEVTKVTGKSDIEVFKKLRRNKTFPIWRTADDLMGRFNRLKKVPEKQKGKKANDVNIIHEDIEQNLDFVNLAQKDVPTDNDSSTIPRDLSKAKTAFIESRRAPHDAIAGSTLSPQLPANAIAQLRGRVVAYNIIDSQVVIGRSTPEKSVDINLLHEGPCVRTSKLQAVIKLIRATDQFIIFNIGHNPFCVDDRVIHRGQKSKLQSNSKVTFGLLEMLFLRNEAKRIKPIDPQSGVKLKPATITTNSSTNETTIANKPVTPFVTSFPPVTVVPVVTFVPKIFSEIKKLQITDEAMSVNPITVDPQKLHPVPSSKPVPEECENSKEDDSPKKFIEIETLLRSDASSKSIETSNSNKSMQPVVTQAPVASAQTSASTSEPIELEEDVSQMVQQETAKRFQLAKAIREAQVFNQSIVGADVKTNVLRSSSEVVPKRPVVFQKPAITDKDEKNLDDSEKKL